MRIPTVWLVSFSALSALSSSAFAASRQGEVVYRSDFEGAETLNAWEGAGDPHVRLVPGWRGSQSVLVGRTKDEGIGYRSIRLRLPVEKLRGARVKVEAMVKAEDVAKPANPWNGVKCMLHTVASEGQSWQQQDNLFGSFDWKPVGFVAEVSPNATEAWLVLGLEQTTGRAWFDQLKMTIVGFRRRVPAERPAGPAYKGHDLPRLRGTMIGPNVSQQDLRVLGGQWKANHIRWQLIWGGFPRSPADNGDLAAYDAWLESALTHLDKLLPVCAELGIQVLIDLHTPPGGRNDSSECRLFHEARFQDAFDRVWAKIARRYQGQKAVWGYDLVNEPVEGVVADGLLDWHALATRTARRVRSIDPQHAIVVEPAPWGGPQALEFFDPLPVDRIVYSVHMYLPFKFTHQGIYGNPSGVHYPGVIDGKQADRQELRKLLAPVIAFQRDYNVHVYLGEFSAIRWAPGQSGANYLRDAIEIFEENGWDWAYHAFREWDGWSVEHGPDPKDHTPAKTPTDRQRLLRSWFAKNVKPQ
jgi:hypothetical protein